MIPIAECVQNTKMVVKINNESELRIIILLTVLSSSSNRKTLNIRNAISEEKLRQNR